MKFKPGDVVIKKTGGNKMTVDREYKNDTEYHYKCYWFIENNLFEGVFIESDITTLDEYKRLLKIEERDDKIFKILGNKGIL